MKKFTAVLLVLMAFAMALPASGYAASPWTENAGYADKAVGKFQFGFKNLVLGWGDLFYEPQRDTANCPAVLKGIARGIVHATLNTAGGALHVATFPLPQIDIPLPENGIHCS